MVGDRGMITSARIQAMNQLDDGTQRPDPYQWITALRAPAIKSSWPTTARSSSPCSTSRTSPRSPPMTSPASG